MCNKYLKGCLIKGTLFYFFEYCIKESENRLKSTHRVHQSGRNLQTLCIFLSNEKIIHDCIIYNYLIATYLAMLWIGLLNRHSVLCR